jgi:hypothetical protein
MIPQVRLGDACEFVLDGTHASPERSERGIPVLSAQNVTDGRLDYETGRFTTEAEFEAFRRRLDLRQNDVLLTIVGSIGRSAVVVEPRPAVLQRNVAVLRPRAGTLDSRYLFHSVQDIAFQAQLQRATNQSSQAGAYLGKLKEVAIPLPAIAEQRRIAAILDKAETLRLKRIEAASKSGAARTAGGGPGVDSRVRGRWGLGEVGVRSVARSTSSQHDEAKSDGDGGKFSWHFSCPLEIRHSVARAPVGIQVPAGVFCYLNRVPVKVGQLTPRGFPFKS